MKKTNSSRQWLDRHFKDPFVKKSQEDGYRSRAVYKLLAIQEKDKLIKRGMTVVDLGAAPGSWCEVLSDLVGEAGRVIALDLLPMDPINDVEFIQGDFTEDAVFAQLLKTLGDSKVDVVLSDMAPNMSGIKGIDQPRSMYLVELALDFAQRVLKPKGAVLFKVFQGVGIEALQNGLRSDFEKLIVRKPDASRAKSKEVYLLARGYRGVGSNSL